jgi:hypothetical protein
VVADDVPRALTSRIPLGRLSKAEEVAVASLVLGSEQSSEAKQSTGFVLSSLDPQQTLRAYNDNNMPILLLTR